MSNSLCTKAIIMATKISRETLEQRVRDLEKSVAAYEKIFNAANDAVFIHNPHNGRIIDVNRKTLEMYGYTKDEIVQLDVASLSEGSPPYDQVQVKKNVQRAASDGDHLFEWKAKKKNGDIFWVEVNLKKTVLDDEELVIAIVRDISTRKQQEDELKTQMSRFEYVVQATNLGIWEWNVQTGEIVLNERWANIIGYTLEEITPISIESWLKHTHPEDLTQIQAALDDHFRGESDYYEIEYRMKHKDGSWVWVLEKGKVTSWTEDGEPLWMYGTHQDVTQRKLAENRLRRSEELSNSIQRLGKIGAWEWDSTTNKVFWTEEVYRIHDMEPDLEEQHMDLTIKKSLACYRPEDRPVISNAFRKCFEEGVTYNLEFPFTTTKGRQIWIQTSAIRTGGKDGKHVMGYIMDITDRKQNEEAVRRGESKYKTIIHTSIDGFWLIDLQGRILEVNDAYCRMSGYSEEELLSMSIPELEGKTGSGEVASEINNFLREGYGRFETKHRRKDGSLYDVEVRVQSLSKENGRLVVFIRDITMLKKAEQENKDLESQLIQAQKMEAIGRLAGGVAHDYNNMLGVIQGYTELSLEQTDSTSKLHAALQEIMKAAKRSADITRQLLGFARRQPIAPSVVDLNKLISDMLKMIKRLIGEDIHLVWLPGKDLWKIKIDPTQVDQIIVNLCINARDAIQGVGKLTIETHVVTLDEDYCKSHLGFSPGDFVVLSVSDNGSGMEKEVLQNVFEPFFTTKDMNKGTGLGLSTVYGIVRQNGGFINVYSEPGIGTTFKIYFARSIDDELQVERKSVLEADVYGYETILLVEDETTILEITKTMLERLGYNVLVATTPTQAIDLAREQSDRIHLLITDVVMPEMNGRELANSILSIYPDLKFLFMSGYTSNVVAHHGLLDEGIHFLQKPFSMKELSRVVREALGDSPSVTD